MYTLLIIDDDPQDRAALKGLIREKYPEIRAVYECRGGPVALRTAIQYRPDILAIADCGENGAGFDFLEQLQTLGFPGVAFLMARERTLEAIDRLFRLNAAGYIQKPVTIKALMGTMACVLGRLKAERARGSEPKQRQDPPKEQVPNNIPPQMRRAFRYLNDHFEKNLTLDGIARDLGVSKYHLCRQFKSCLGVSIWQQLTALRIRKAEELLLYSHFSLLRIAEICGFPDASYFSAVFKKHTGMTPTSYRDAYGA